MPVGLGHQGHHAVAAYAGVIDDDGDVLTVVAVLPACQGVARLPTVTDVEGQQFALSAAELQRLLRLGLVGGIVYQNVVALAGQSHGDGPAYAAAASCY